MMTTKPRDRISVEEYKGHLIEIVVDDDPQNPRGFDCNLGTMVCFHSRYNLGDRTELKESMFQSWGELEEQLIKEGDTIVVPLYMMDHSSLTIRAGSGFSAEDPGHWDWGQIGFIYADREKIRDCYNVKYITQKVKSLVRGSLDAEVREYNAFINGDACGYRITRDDNEIDCCYGYFDHAVCLDEAKAIIDGREDDNNVV